MTFPETYVHIELVDANPWREDPDALRAFAEESGYLFFRGLLEAAWLDRVRGDALPYSLHSNLEPASGVRLMSSSTPS